MIDKLLTFWDDTEVLTTAASTHLIDLRAARQMGPGNTLWVVAHVTTAMTDAGSDSTMTLTLETDTLATFGSAVVAQTIGTFAAVSAAGTMLAAPIAKFAAAEQFLRAKLTVANGDLSTGKFTCYIASSPQEATLYPNAITITH